MPAACRDLKEIVSTTNQWRTLQCDGVAGFFQGVTPAVAKGAATNSISFLGYGQIKSLMQGPPGADGTPPPALTPMQAMLAGGTAGAVSAVLTQPIDTVKANMMGLEASRYSSSLACAADLVRAGGFAALMNGVGPRVVRGEKPPIPTLRPSLSPWSTQPTAIANLPKNSDAGAVRLLVEVSFY